MMSPAFPNDEITGAEGMQVCTFEPYKVISCFVGNLESGIQIFFCFFLLFKGFTPLDPRPLLAVHVILL